MKDERVICAERHPKHGQCWREENHVGSHLVGVEIENGRWEWIQW